MPVVVHVIFPAEGSFLDEIVRLITLVPAFLLAISVGWLSEQLHEHYEAALEAQAAQKAEALGTMAAGIAHDFNNILTAMVANAELIAGDTEADGENTRDELAQLKGAARRGAGIVRTTVAALSATPGETAP